MKEETRKVVVLDWEDKINKLQPIIKDLERILEIFENPCKDRLSISNALYYLRIIEEKIN